MFMKPIIGVPMFLVNRNSDLNIGENILMKIGQRIREARKAAGMTQDQLATKVGMKQNSISELEKGDSAGTTNVAKFAQALRVNALWLETGMGDRSTSAVLDLDSEGGDSVNDIVAKVNAMVALELITEKEANILIGYRVASEEGKTQIEDIAILAERDQLLVVHDKAKS
jgi:transcriptional regulator with XRE-family HTH domain